MAEVHDLIPLMKEMRNTLSVKSEEFKSTLAEIGVTPGNYNKVIRAIDRQIQTAGNEFTVAFVGEFKTGKSTIINTLLELSGEERLSSEYKADTAKCIRLLYKDDSNDEEAEILFEGEAESEKLTWREAKKYTSQIALDRDAGLREKADRIQEVRYYLEKPLLVTLNILDLPGTGSSHMADHTELTLQKLNEADIVFWVVSTLNEPGAEAVENLQYMNQKIIPIINVWQVEQEAVTGLLKPEELENFMKESYSSYFNGEVKPIYYYAGEIEYAQTHGLEVKSEWGRDQLLACIRRLGETQQETEKKSRLLNNLYDALGTYRSFIEEHKKGLGCYELAVNSESSIQLQLEKEAYRIHNLVHIKIRERAKETAEELLLNCEGSADEFIEDQMESANVRFLLKSIGRKNKEKLEKSLKRKFEEEYLNLNDTPNWYQESLDAYMKDVTNIIQISYQEFECNLRESSIKAENAKLSTGFIKNMVARTSEVLKKQVGSNVITMVTGTIFFAFGGELIALLYALFLEDSGTDRMTNKITGVQKRARQSLNRQKPVITNNLVTLGDELEEQVYRNILEEMNGKREEREQKYTDARNKLDEMEGLLNEYEEQLRSF